MRPLYVLLAMVFIAAPVPSVLAQESPAATEAAPPVAPKRRGGNKLPPCPPGVTHVEWSELIKTPVGPLGLELTDKIKTLDGKKVRLLGYMVQRDEAVPGALWLTPYPVNIEESEAGFADLPPQAVYVLIPYRSKIIAPYTPRPLLLTGTLSVGQRAGEEKEATSLFRLTLESPAERPTRAKPARPKASGRPRPAKTSAPE